LSGVQADCRGSAALRLAQNIDSLRKSAKASHLILREGEGVDSDSA